MTRSAFSLVALGLSLIGLASNAAGEDTSMQLPISAQVTTDIAGKAASAVQQGVLRVICRSTSSQGTGFLHSSGNVLTAAHVVKGCAAKDVVLILSSGQAFAVASVDADEALDLALVQPATTLPGQALSIAPVAPPTIGMQVATWGYPGGYSGLAPLLSVGYLAGTQEFKVGPGKAVERWVVNAAFNGGNSGGPLLSLENGSIVGVVSSKLAPLPPDVATILELLSKQKSGFVYEATQPDGTKATYTEGQLIGTVLEHLRHQVQLVIGYSVKPDDIADFLKAKNIEP